MSGTLSRGGHAAGDSLLVRSGQAVLSEKESSLRVDSAEVVRLNGRPISAAQLRSVLQHHGVTPPVPTGATYDTTTEHRTGARFHLTPKWIAAALAALLAVAAAALVIVFAARSIPADLRAGREQAVGADMAAIVCAAVYGTAVVVVYLYAVREKHNSVNRLDPRTWIRELHRIQRVARRAPTDAEIEDAVLDRASPPRIGTQVSCQPDMRARSGR